MSKQTHDKYKKNLRPHMDFGDMDFETIMESDLEDYEIAAELGMSLNQVSKLRSELFED